MKKQKKSTHTSRSARRAGTAIAATVLALPAIGLTQEAAAQKTPGRTVERPTTIEHKTGTTLGIKLDKHKGTALTIVGLDGGSVVYQNGRNEIFKLDPATGDMIFLKPGAFKSVALKFYKEQKFSKESANVTFQGTDAAGNLLHRNTRGEMFYLDAATGDMVFVK